MRFVKRYVILEPTQGGETAEHTVCAVSGENMRKIIALCAVCIVLIAAVTMTGCLGNKPYDSQATVNPRGAADDGIPTIAADQMSELLSNPDRGLRMETYITLGDPLWSYPTNNEDPYQRATDMIEKYRSDSPTLCQVYVYLTNYVDSRSTRLRSNSWSAFLP